MWRGGPCCKTDRRATSATRIPARMRIFLDKTLKSTNTTRSLRIGTRCERLSKIWAHCADQAIPLCPFPKVGGSAALPDAYGASARVLMIRRPLADALSTASKTTKLSTNAPSSSLALATSFTGIMPFLASSAAVSDDTLMNAV